MQKKDYQNLHNYVNCVILIYIKQEKTAIVVEGGRMKRRERYKRVLGILIAILCMEISALISIAGSKAWNQALENMDRIAIHTSRTRSGQRSTNRIFKVMMMRNPHTISMRKGSTPQSIERHKKVHSIQSGDNYILPHGRNECNNRPKWASSYWRLTVLLLRKHFAQEELQTNLKVCSFFVQILSKLSQKSAKVLMFRSRKKWK